MVSGTTNSFGVTTFNHTPWGDISTPVDTASSIGEAMRISNLDFKVETAPVFYQNPRTGGFYQSKKENGIRRADTLQELGTCKQSWQPYQNADAFKWFEKWLDSGLVKLHSAGSINGGEKVFIVAKLNTPPIEIAKGHSVENYLINFNAHTGRGGCASLFTPIAPSCGNMFPAIFRSESTRILRFRHSGNLTANMETMRGLIDIQAAEFVATAEQFKWLNSRVTNKAKIREYVRELSGIKLDVKWDNIQTKTRNTIEKIEHLINDGKGVGPSIRGTWFAAFNGFNEYLNHEYGHNVNSRMDSLWFGTSSTRNRQALSLALGNAA